MKANGKAWIRKNIETGADFKVIQEVKERFPQLNQVPFKYEEGVDHEELMELPGTDGIRLP